MAKKPSRERQRLGIPTEVEIQDRLKRWLKFYVDKSSKSAIHRATGLSLAHISNLYNHAHLKPGLDFLICMVYGMDVSPRELLREDPAVSQDPLQQPSQTNAGRSRKRAPG